MQALLDVGTWVFMAACLVELAFLTHYTIIAKAFHSAIGVMFVLRSASILMAGVAIILGRTIGQHYPNANYPGRAYVTLALFAFVLASALSTYLTFLYERYFHDDNPDLKLTRDKIRVMFRRARHPRLRAAEPRPVTGPIEIGTP